MRRLVFAVALAGCSAIPRDPLPVLTSPPALPPLIVEAPAQDREQELLDTWSLAAREDGASCRDQLKDAGYKFRALPEKSERDKNGCGIPHGIVLVRGPTGIAYEPPVTIDCSLARALGGVERIVQEEAERNLHARITKIGDLGGYACRPRNYRRGASLSAHAFGSAVDVASFQPAKGPPALVLRDWPRDDDRSRFLHALFSRLRSHDADLTYVVGPDFNAIHRNHFHLDRGGWQFWFDRDARPRN